MNQQFSKEEVVKIAKFQSIICWLFFISILFRGCILYVNATKLRITSVLLPILVVLASLFLIAALLYFVYRLGGSMKLKNLWLYVLGTIIPLVGLLVLLSLIIRASKILKEQHVRVGLMGANKEDLNMLP